jgi:hypothetical protein
MELFDYAKILAEDMVENKFALTPSSQSAYSIILTPPPAAIDLTTANDPIMAPNWDAVTKISTLSSLPNDVACKHVLCVNNEFTSHIKTKYGENIVGKQQQRGKCIMCCRNTAYFCKECIPLSKRLKSWCCSDAADQEGEQLCLLEHQDEIRMTNIYNNIDLP